MNRAELFDEANIRELIELGEGQLLLRLGIARKVKWDCLGDARLELDGGINDQIAVLEEALKRLRNRPPPVVVGLDALEIRATKGH